MNSCSEIICRIKKKILVFFILRSKKAKKIIKIEFLKKGENKNEIQRVERQ